MGSAALGTSAALAATFRCSHMQQQEADLRKMCLDNDFLFKIPAGIGSPAANALVRAYQKGMPSSSFLIE